VLNSDRQKKGGQAAFLSLPDTSLTEGLARFGADLLQDHGQRAKAGEGRLGHIESNEAGHPQPVDVMHLGQGQAKQDYSAGEGQNDSINTHYDVSRYVL